ncbi:ATP-binding protein [Planctomicrobium sp. SH664]|uniref:sensor histidine kinase n=1 Tax=Planctomicrobium sp. SH664 TaxID=3448125 RepID=UPI003F5CA127
MRWPIRNQILLPLIAIQLTVVLGLSSLSAWWSLRLHERDVQRRIDELAQTIQAAQFPLTQPVLEQLRGLSGAEFVMLNDSRQLEFSTLSTTSEPALAEQLAQIPTLPAGPESPLVDLQDRQFLVRSVSRLQHAPTSLILILSPAERVEADRRSALLRPFVVGSTSLLLTALAVIYVAQRMGQRIQAIERHVAQVAAGQFGEIPLPRRDDELRDLTTSVNRMSLDLTRMAEQIRNTERGHLVRQLAGGIAHQLRNALTGARLAVQLHRRRCHLPDDESLDVALRQLTLTEEQIRGLVALIRDEHRPRNPGVLDSLANEVLLLLRPVCDHRQIRLQLSGSTEGAVVEDSDQMRAALLNLGLNGIEATGTGGTVQFILSRTGEAVIIEVSDDGPGVPEEIRSAIFDPFYTTKHDGMGLGLALVKQAADDHHGKIEYERRQGYSLFRLTCRNDSPRPEASAPSGESLQDLKKS